MLYNLSHLFLDCHVTLILQLVTERVFLKRNAEFSLVDRNVSSEILIGEVAVHAQESVERLKEQNVVARKPIIFDELAIDHPSHTPGLKPLDVAQPNRSRHTRLGHVFIKTPKEMAKFSSDVVQVVRTPHIVVLLEADNGTNHVVINWKGLERLSTAAKEY